VAGAPGSFIGDEKLLAADANASVCVDGAALPVLPASAEAVAAAALLAALLEAVDGAVSAVVVDAAGASTVGLASAVLMAIDRTGPRRPEARPSGHAAVRWLGFRSRLRDWAAREASTTAQWAGALQHRSKTTMSLHRLASRAGVVLAA
jgi:hypothetical protein